MMAIFIIYLLLYRNGLSHNQWAFGIQRAKGRVHPRVFHGKKGTIQKWSGGAKGGFSYVSNGETPSKIVGAWRLHSCIMLYVNRLMKVRRYQAVKPGWLGSISSMDSYTHTTIDPYSYSSIHQLPSMIIYHNLPTSSADSLSIMNRRRIR